MYAVVETGGKQYRVSPGDVIRVEKLDAEKGEEISLDRVLLVSDENGLKVGKPIVDGANVRATVMQVGKGRKITVFKYKRKKNYRRKYGHRQPFTELKIESITA